MAGRRCRPPTTRTSLPLLLLLPLGLLSIPFRREGLRRWLSLLLLLLLLLLTSLSLLARWWGRHVAVVRVRLSRQASQPLLLLLLACTQVAQPGGSRILLFRLLRLWCCGSSTAAAAAASAAATLWAIGPTTPGKPPHHVSNLLFSAQLHHLFVPRECAPQRTPLSFVVVGSSATAVGLTCLLTIFVPGALLLLSFCR